MAYKDLQDFIGKLEKCGELVRISARVSTDLEITQIADRISKKSGPALLFENVEDSEYPVLINAMGSYKRMAMALGVDGVEAKDLDIIARQIEPYLSIGNYLSIKKLFKNIPMFLRLLYVFPLKKLGKGKCQQEIEHQVDLFSLPVLKCWPQDVGKFFTLPLVFTKEHGTKKQNAGMYRMQILDKATTAMHWHKHKDGKSNFNSYKSAGEKMPVSVALGCDPAITYAATAPLPKEIDEMLLAGWIRRKNVKMVKCITNEICVPEDSEFVLEGYVDPSEEFVLEGPFGDHTGYYSLADYYPRFHVTCITHRRNPVYPTTIVGKPPMEDCYMAKATERIFLPILKLQIPEMMDLNLPLEGVFHNCAIISIKDKYPGCAQKVMNAVWGMGQMMYTKLIIIVDETVNVQNFEEVSGTIFQNLTKEKLVLSEGALDALDHSSNTAFYGCRLGVDATSEKSYQKKDEENVDIKTNNYLKKPSLKIIAIDKKESGQGRKAIEDYFENSEERFAISVDGDVDTKNISTVMWKLFNNVDARRDLVIYGGKIGMDATKKWTAEGLTRGWPDDIVMSEDVIAKVEKRWSEYGIGP